MDHEYSDRSAVKSFIYLLLLFLKKLFDPVSES